MEIAAWILIGLVAVVLAKVIWPRWYPRSSPYATLVSIAGAVAGGLLGAKLGYSGASGVDARSVLLAFDGAVLLLLLYRIVQ